MTPYGHKLFLSTLRLSLYCVLALWLTPATSLAARKNSGASADTLKLAQQTTKPDSLITTPDTPAPDTLVIDTLAMQKKLTFLPKHSPAKATLMSAVLPGLGQFYNKKYWKIPVVYAAIGASAFFYIKFQNEFEKYRQAYVDFMDGDESTRSYEKFEIPPGVTTERYLTVYRDNNRRYRDWWMIGLALSYSLNIIDAVVDAHFFDFNVDEDLTLSIQPQLIPAPDAQNRHYGLNLRFSF